MFPAAIHRAVAEALAAAAAAGDLPDLGGTSFSVERPRDRSHGDWATNAALVAARGARRPPGEVAALIVRYLPAVPHLERVEVAGPG
ncbi:MAG: arginyl-tRNA synthetase, partial [Acidobacteria bacterium]|nr:arginyl-tRNA synthetase [Acidobacteriota bacterium]